MENKKFSITGRVKSFSYAFQGLKTFFKTQHNAWVHVLATVITVAAGCYYHLSTNEWCWIIIAVTLVFITEMLNTAIEFLCDHVALEIHPQIKKIKDISASAVLLAAMGAIAIGIIVFLPKIC